MAADRARSIIAGSPFAGAGVLTMSAGVGLMHGPKNAEDLYRLADRALYDAKRRGRNRTCCLTGSFAEAAQTAPGLSPDRLAVLAPTEF